VQSPALAIAFGFCNDAEQLRRQLDEGQRNKGTAANNASAVSPAKRSAPTATTSAATSAPTDDTDNTTSTSTADDTDASANEDDDEDRHYLDVTDAAARSRIMRGAPSAWARLSSAAKHDVVEHFSKPVAALLRPFCASNGTTVTDEDLASAAERFVCFKETSIFGPGHGCDVDDTDVTAARSATATATTTTTTTTTTTATASQTRPKATLAWAIEVLQQHLRSLMPNFSGFRFPLSRSAGPFHLW
jgi:hypothetical protein